MGFLGEGTQPAVSPTLNGFLALFLHKKRAVVSEVGLGMEKCFKRKKENQFCLLFLKLIVSRLGFLGLGLIRFRSGTGWGLDTLRRKIPVESRLGLKRFLNMGLNHKYRLADLFDFDLRRLLGQFGYLFAFGLEWRQAAFALPFLPRHLR